MSQVWNNTVMEPAPEQFVNMTGNIVTLGTLSFNPCKLVLDNQATVSAVLYISRGGQGPLVQWKTFSPGEAIIIDDDLYTLPVGTIFAVNGASGIFTMSYFYVPQ
jgi:hypothetical protein